MISYEKIFSRMRGEYNDPKELSLNKDDLLEIYTERLHAVVGVPKVRKLFSSITLNDDEQSIVFELNNPVDDTSDEEFVINIIVLGMVIKWLQPQVDSVLYTTTVIGGKEEKKILDAHSSMVNRLDNMKKEQQKLIRDYGYAFIPIGG